VVDGGFENLSTKVFDLFAGFGWGLVGGNGFRREINDVFELFLELPAIVLLLLVIPSGRNDPSYPFERFF